MKTLFSVLFLLLLSACASYEKPKENLPISKNEVGFCSLVGAPPAYESKNIQTKGIVLGYHTFIFYSPECLTNEKVLALKMDYEARRKLVEAIQSNKVNYQTSFLNNNLYAEITVSGEFRANDEKEPEIGPSRIDVFKPKYKFIVSRIENINILSEEIYPSEEAMGVRIVNLNQKWNK